MKYLPLIFALAIPAVPALADEAAPTPTPSPTPTAANADDETVINVTATRNPEPVASSSSTVTVITREELEAKQVFDLTDALRLAPGISVTQAGTLGKTVSIFTRGTESRHTLVLIDGIRANNPDDGRFDPGQLPVENIERIEFVRGPQSALYGSDAIGGVINIITRKGEGPVRGGGKFEYGTQDTNRQVAMVNGDLGGTRLSLTASRLSSNGTFENDEFRDLGTSIRLDRALNPRQDLTFLTRIAEAHYGVPGQRFINPDPNQGERTRDVNFSLQWVNRAGKRRDQIIAGANNHHLQDDDTRDAAFPFFFETTNRVRQLEAQTAYDFGQHVVTAGIEQRKEVVAGSYSADTDTRGIFVQDEFKSGKFTLVPGYRRERNSQYGNFNSYRFASSYDITDKTRIKGTYGTAFKAPAFIFLYYPGFSNPNLQPEKSKGMELGVEHQLKNGGRVEATLFHNRIKDLIDGGLLANINTVKTKGIELAVDTPVAKGWRAKLNQTFTDIDSTSATPPTRRPKYNTNADLIADRGQWSYDFGVLSQGKTWDRAGFLDPVTQFDGYTRFDLTVGYKVNTDLQFYVRAQNLLNKKYAEVAGYPTTGFNIVFGVKTLTF